jgi:hypothetical protein
MRTITVHSSVTARHFISLLPRVRVEGQWIISGRRRVIWLPNDYRQNNNCAFHDGVLALALNSGRVAFIGIEHILYTAQTS